ncbi:MAG: acetyl-CoA carboxylase biotin carboxylase subunit [Bacteroidetes bacterium]|nr:acetyl-CoA carboxylase biotin carboxylase subunit [Bacteroidota bacterium]MBU1719810.1 acetyl-CoA carboxylase biotin carboxylase subunit [Bacteroidota bacterium]
MIKKILIANRGEIAVRIMRTCREIGIPVVAVFSEVDRPSMHVRYAEEVCCIGPSPSSESYLVIDKIIEAAKKTGADAIHPGYGFLSENAAFSERCQKEGIIFIGPDPYAISTMGDKITARQTMIKAGVPVVPGTTECITDENKALEIVKEIGVPVMIKASAGGGGKGMRLVKNMKDVIPSVRAAQSEAKAAFGNDAVYIEKYIASPHHIEFQILADKHGNTVHLFERECSVQRRHQKVIEETPSCILTPEVRKKMGETAVAAAKAVNYHGAGTVEFIVDDDLNFYFLEMNTRLQVEHTVTERVVGVDLVREQINIANGLPLAFVQEDLFQDGHSIQCRIYAEDTDNNFMPCPGIIKYVREPHGFGIRIDGYVFEGFEIPIYYDPLIAKLIVWGKTRDEAIKRMKRALYEYKITGIKTSIKFLQRIMEATDFVSGKYSTHFIENNKAFLFESKTENSFQRDIAAMVAYYDYLSQHEKSNNSEEKNPAISEWKSHGRKAGMMRL